MSFFAERTLRTSHSAVHKAILADTKPERYKTDPVEALPGPWESQNSAKKACPFKQYRKKLSKAQMTSIRHLYFHPHSPETTRKQEQTKLFWLMHVNGSVTHGDSSGNYPFLTVATLIWYGFGPGPLSQRAIPIFVNVYCTTIPVQHSHTEHSKSSKQSLFPYILCQARTQ